MSASSIRKNLHSVLSNGIPSINGRVYPIIMPQDTRNNCIVYQVLGNSDITGLTCTTPVLSRYMLQIDIFAATYAESVALVEEVSVLLRDKFLIFNLSSFEDYANITLKYRQILSLSIEEKQI